MLVKVLIDTKICYNVQPKDGFKQWRSKRLRLMHSYMLQVTNITYVIDHG